MMSAPASAKASMKGSTGEIIRWTSSGFCVCGLRAFTTAGPIVRFGTKWPSITSTWIQSAPAESIARTSSPSRAKSAERIEGEMRTGCCTSLSLNGPESRGKESGRLIPLYFVRIARCRSCPPALGLVETRQKPLLLLDRIIRPGVEEVGGDPLALLALQRADRIDEGAAGLEPAGDASQHRLLGLGQLGDRPGADAVDDVGMAAEDAGRRAGRVEQDRVDLRGRRPGHHISRDDPRRKTGAGQILGMSRQTTLRDVDRGHVPAG